ncbi:MAG: hypothetical protein LBP59_16610 [Planctomycetaceae bacterium]|jgi:hypothetical protein|nr:hypothetical protein [Planctomycetaceae bacterium]
MKYSISITIVSILLSNLLIAGCSGKLRPDGMPRLVPCSILVKQDATPLANANVSIIPENGSKWNAAGVTDNSGVAKLYTLSQYEGVPEGKYKVVISKTETVLGIIGASDRSSEGTPDQHFNLVEPQYSNPTDTPLTIEVTKKNSHYEVNAGKKVKIQEEQR